MQSFLISACGRYSTPLVADIHFNPKVALLVADAFEKIRINPGNFSDGRKTFEEMTYDDEASFRAGMDDMREVVSQDICSLQRSSSSTLGVVPAFVQPCRYESVMMYDNKACRAGMEVLREVELGSPIRQ